MISTGPAQNPFRLIICPSLNRGQCSMGSQRKLWEDMAPLEKLAAIRELAEQLKALRDGRAPRQEADEAQPIQLRPSACSRRGNAFLLSTAIPFDHSTAGFHLPRHPAWNFRPATERDGACYFGDEKPRQQKLAGFIEDVTDRKKPVMGNNQPVYESSRVSPSVIGGP
jgi:hypothetical protein